jgi:hypothetical protein
MPAHALGCGASFAFSQTPHCQDGASSSAAAEAGLGAGKCQSAGRHAAACCLRRYAAKGGLGGGLPVVGLGGLNLGLGGR